MYSSHPSLEDRKSPGSLALPGGVLALLAHLKQVLDDAAFSRIDARLWDTVEALARAGAAHSCELALSSVGLMTLQEVWEATGGSPGVRASRDDVLDALQVLDESGETGTACPPTS